MSPTLVLHVERAFSAQPTLGDLLGDHASVHEVPLAEALAGDLEPHLVWTSDATPDTVHLLRSRFPDAALLATVNRQAGSDTVLPLFAAGADLVLRDEGVLLAAAALAALARRAPAAAGPSAAGDQQTAAPRTPDPALTTP